MGGNSDPFRHEVKHKEQANCFDYTMGIQTDLILPVTTICMRAVYIELSSRLFVLRVLRSALVATRSYALYKLNIRPLAKAAMGCEK